jgi:hypothetical protein
MYPYVPTVKRVLNKNHVHGTFVTPEVEVTKIILTKVKSFSSLLFTNVDFFQILDFLQVATWI